MRGIYDLIKAKDKKPLKSSMVNQKWLFILRRNHCNGKVNTTNR
jgi:hypothetical protein